MVLMSTERSSIHGLVHASYTHSLTLGAPRLPRGCAVEVTSNAESLLGAVSLVALGDRSQQCAQVTTLSADLINTQQRELSFSRVVVCPYDTHTANYQDFMIKF